MSLITPGYFPDTYFPESYWQDEYWPDFGTGEPAEDGLFINFGNCITSDDTKITVSANPAYARTDNFYEGEIAFQFQASELNTSLDEMYIGLNVDTDPESAFLEECFKFSVSGLDGSKLASYYNAGPGGEEHEYTSETVFKITYLGTTISYFIDNVLIDTAEVDADLNFYIHFKTGEHGSFTGDAITDFEILTLASFYEDIVFNSLITKLIDFDSAITIEKEFDSPLED